MSAARDRSLERAWAIGLAVALLGGGLAVAAERGMLRRDRGTLRVAVADSASGAATTPHASAVAPADSSPAESGAVPSGARAPLVGARNGEVVTPQPRTGDSVRASESASGARLHRGERSIPDVERAAGYASASGAATSDASRSTSARGAPPHREVAKIRASSRHETDATPTVFSRRATTRAAAPADDRQRAWADSVLGTLTLRAKAAQLFMRWIPGSYRDTTTKEYAETRRWVTEDSLGGFIISIGSPGELAAKTNALQRLSRVPLLFAADIEFGPGQRLIPGGAVFPPEMGIAATGDTAFSCAHGRVTAEQARAVGIRWVFTPDVDVNVDPANPIVNTRAYADRASVVTRYAVPFIRCAEAAGMLTTAKHFAAHGAAHVDSHIATPVVSMTRAELDRADLLPFRAAIDAGVSALMSAHVALPRLSGDSVPVSLNPRVLRRIVREEWGFQGVVVTDALWMGGVAKSGGTATDAGSLAVRALVAGNDVILDPADHKTMIAALVRAVENGTISVARLDSSVRRVLIAKAKAGLDRDRYVDERAVAARVPSAADDSVAALAVRRSLVFARGSAATSGLAKLRRGDTLRVFTYLDEGEHPAPGLSPGTTFASELAALLAPRGVSVDAVTWTPRSTPLLADAVRKARGARAAVLAPFVRPLALKGTIGLPPAAEGVYRTVLATRPDAVVVSFGDPYLVRQLPGVRTYLLAWNPWSPEAERSAARVLAGDQAAPGQLPISLEGRVTSASNAAATTAAQRAALRLALLDSIRHVLDRAVADSAFPGAYAVVGTRDGIAASYGAGRIDWSADAPRPDEHTLWDLASLTKVVGTTSALMQLVNAKRVSLDAPVQRYVPRWTGAGKERVTVRDLLLHRSGLPATVKYYKQTKGRDSVLALVHATPLDTVPRARTLYSDVGAILLGEIVERVSGQRLDAYLARHLFSPLGMRDTRFFPLSAAGAADRARLVARTAPTERDPWRGRLVRAEVHDENAYAMGGVAGHAGLFSSAHDLARFARALLGDGRLGAARVFAPGTVAQFATPADATASSRALGWDTATGANSAGHLMSPLAFGHTGFTGTSLWVDPASGVFVLLLSNRVDPTRENQRIGAVRVALADAAMGALSGAASATASAAPTLSAPVSPATRAVP